MPYGDLREFIERLEIEGKLQRIKKQVDWNLELSHVAKINETQVGPALLFENVKDYPGMPVLTSLFTTKERVAMALDMPPEAKYAEIANDWVKRIEGKRVPPRWVNTGPCKENIDIGDTVNLFKFPAPWFYPKDGGRYIGTAIYLITRNLDTGRINLGTYRGMIIDEKTIGIQILQAKDAEIDLRGYAERKIPMPVAYVMGGDPALFLCSSTLFPLTDSEYDIVGALRDRPIEVVRGETVDLPIPATAEIVIEGEIVPGDVLPEGPFGEYTGYYTGKGEVGRECIRVKAVTHRNNPILWSTTVGKPLTDTHMIQAINRTAALWSQLQAMKIPGLTAAFCPPGAGGRFLAIISVKQMYPGHGMHVGLGAFATIMGNYGLKTVIVVDDDIDVENMDQVWYALGFRYQPARGTQIISRGRSTILDPSLEIEKREITSRIIIDATLPYEWKEKPVPIELDKDMKEKVLNQWNEYF